MSFATRCTACGTIFRVVQDQLRVSEGWVRCGRCNEVFDAQEHLFDIDLEAPPAWPPGASRSPSPAKLDLVAPPPSIDASAINLDWRTQDTDTFLGQAPLNDTPSVKASGPLPHSDAHARYEPFWDAPDLDPAEVAPDPRADLPEPKGMTFAPEPALAPPAFDDGPDVVLAPGLADHSTPEPAPIDEVLPEFVRRADGLARWQQPGVRFALGMASGLLILGLLVQLAWHFRSPLAARSAQARAVLIPLCAGLGKPLQPWQHLAALRVENSSLTPTASGNHYKLSINLSNKSEWELALPWVELSLSDIKGAPILKRALSPQDFKLSRNSMTAGGEQSMELVFTTGSAAVSGYTVEIFHP